MIRIFSNNLQQTTLFLAIYTILIRLFFFFTTPFKLQITNSGANYISSLFLPLNQNKTLVFVISTVLVYISALLINNLVARHEAIYKNTYLTAYFYVLLNSLFPEQFFVGPVLLVNLFIILSTNEIFKLYKSENPTNSIFFASFLGGFSVLMNLTYFAYFVFMIIGLNVFRPFKLKEHLAALFGFAMPLYLGIMVNYLVNGTFLPNHIQFPDYSEFKGVPWALMSALPLISLILILSLLRQSRNYWRNSIKVRRMTVMLVVLLIISTLLVLTGIQNQKQELSLLMTPVSVFLAYYFTATERVGRWKELLNIFLLLAVLVFQLRPVLELF